MKQQQKNPPHSSNRKPLIIISKTARGFLFMCAHHRKQMTEAQTAAVGLRGGREPLEQRNKTKYQCEGAGGMFGEFGGIAFAFVFLALKDKCCVCFLISSHFRRCQRLQTVAVPVRCKINLTSYQPTQLSESVLLFRKSDLCDVTRGTDISPWYYLT